jgi:hypothetical protein
MSPSCGTPSVVLQVERIEKGLQGGGRIGAMGMEAPNTPSKKLAAALHEENEKFVGSEGDKQQLIMRWAQRDTGWVWQNGLWCMPRPGRRLWFGKTVFGACHDLEGVWGLAKRPSVHATTWKAMKCRMTCDCLAGSKTVSWTN